MQLYIVQFKQYQGIILIFLKHVDNSKQEGDNCNVVPWVSSSTETNKATFISKNSSPQQEDIKQFSHDNCTVKNFRIFLHT